MHQFIPQVWAKFIIFIVLFLGCDANTASHLNDYQLKTIKLPSEETFQVYIAEGALKQAKGLSDIEPEDFPKDLGMFFPGEGIKERQFWMPNTLFNLDIIYLSEDLYVIDIHRNLPRFRGFEPRSKIPMSKKVKCTHVLEVVSGSELAKKIQPGMLLKWSDN